MRFGLRAQIALTLLASTALTGFLVGFPGLNLTERALLEREVRAGWRLAGVALEALGDVGAADAVGQQAEIERVLNRLYEGGVAEQLAWIGPAGDVRARLPESPETGTLPVDPSTVAASDQVAVGVLAAPDGQRYLQLLLPLGGDAGTVALWLWTGEIDDQLETARFLTVLYALLAAVVVLIAGFVLLSRVVVAPIRRVRVATERVAAGDHARRLAIDSRNEIGDLAASFNHMLDRLEEGRGALERQVTALETAKRDLERAQRAIVRGEKLASVGRLAAGVAHEVGNPLAAVLGLVEVMRDDPELSAEERDDLLGRVERELLRIHTTIRDLLDYSRTGAEDASEASLPDVVEQARKLVEAQPRFRDIDVTIDCEPDLPLVRADADRLLQVLVNLLLNAADALHDDRSGGAGGRGRIAVRLRRDAEGMALSVADNGPGVAPEARGHLFEPFFTTKPPGQGTGLGLAICESIVEGLGGELSVDPGGGQRGGERVGATFTIWLPAHVESGVGR